MNANKPVAWRRQLDTGVYMYQEYYFGEAEPLYTHPVKEQLTDEDILKLQAEYGIDSDLTCHSVKDFVEAILRKASEK